MNEAINLMPIPIINPKSDPIPARNDLLNSSPFIISAPMAPIIGPSINPTGGKKKIPKIIPIVAPQMPALDPPIFFVPQIGTI